MINFYLFLSLSSYPDAPKEKLKNLYQPYLVNNTNQQNGYDMDNLDATAVRKSKSATSSKSQLSLPFDRLIIPFYLPNFDIENNLEQIQNKLIAEASNASNLAFQIGLKTELANYAPKIAQKYEFPWGLVTGLFERFTTSCFIYSDLYRKMHFKNLILAFTEDNTIGYTKKLKTKKNLINQTNILFVYLEL